MVTDPTQQRLNKRISTCMWLQWLVFGIMLALFVGGVWAANHRDHPIFPDSLLSFDLPFILLLLGIWCLIVAKVMALRQQLYPTSVQGLPFSLLVLGVFHISLSIFLLISRVFDFDLFFSLLFMGVVTIVACCLLAIGGYLYYRRNHRRAAHP